MSQPQPGLALPDKDHGAKGSTSSEAASSNQPAQKKARRGSTGGGRGSVSDTTQPTNAAPVMEEKDAPPVSFRLAAPGSSKKRRLSSLHALEERGPLKLPKYPPSTVGSTTVASASASSYGDKTNDEEEEQKEEEWRLENSASAIASVHTERWLKRTLMEQEKLFLAAQRRKQKRKAKASSSKSTTKKEERQTTAKGKRGASSAASKHNAASSSAAANGNAAGTKLPEEEPSKEPLCEQLRVLRVKDKCHDSRFFPYAPYPIERLQKDMKVSIVLNLYPNGFTLSGFLSLSGSNSAGIEPGPISYVAYPHGHDTSTSDFIRTIDSGRLPPDFIDLLDDIPCHYYDGCLLVQLRDYRGNNQLANGAPPMIRHILLRPDPTETLINDVEQICAEHEDWTPEQCLLLEQQILRVIAPPLCLDVDKPTTKPFISSPPPLPTISRVLNYNKCKLHITPHIEGLPAHPHTVQTSSSRPTQENNKVHERFVLLDFLKERGWKANAVPGAQPGSVSDPSVPFQSRPQNRKSLNEGDKTKPVMLNQNMFHPSNTNLRRPYVIPKRTIRFNGRNGRSYCVFELRPKPHFTGYEAVVREGTTPEKSTDHTVKYSLGNAKRAEIFFHQIKSLYTKEGKVCVFDSTHVRPTTLHNLKSSVTQSLPQVQQAANQAKSGPHAIPQTYVHMLRNSLPVSASTNGPQASHAAPPATPATEEGMAAAGIPRSHPMYSQLFTPQMRAAAAAAAAQSRLQTSTTTPRPPQTGPVYERNFVSVPPPSGSTPSSSSAVNTSTTNNASNSTSPTLMYSPISSSASSSVQSPVPAGALPGMIPSHHHGMAAAAGSVPAAPPPHFNSLQPQHNIANGSTAGATSAAVASTPRQRTPSPVSTGVPARVVHPSTASQLSTTNAPPPSSAPFVASHQPQPTRSSTGAPTPAPIPSTPVLMNSGTGATQPPPARPGGAAAYAHPQYRPLR